MENRQMSKKTANMNNDPESIINVLDKVVNTVLPILRLNQSAKRVISRGAKTSPGMLNAINICCAAKNVISAIKRSNKNKKQQTEKTINE